MRGRAAATDRSGASSGDSAAAPAADGADDGAERGPWRRCIVTRERGERARMIRFVIGSDGVVRPDLAAKAPGRGIWLSARGDVLETACRRGAFSKAARGSVTVPSDLATVLQTGLVRRIAELIGLARRAGQAVCGFQKAREWLVSGRAALVVHAADGSTDERARFLAGATTELLVIAPLTGEALGAVFGRDHAVHVAVSRGRLAEAIGIEAERMAGLAARFEPGPKQGPKQGQGLGRPGKRDPGWRELNLQAGA